MRKVMVMVFAVASFGSLSGVAGAAQQGPDLPKIPQNCHEWNDLLGIDNVRSCDGA